MISNKKSNDSEWNISKAFMIDYVKSEKYPSVIKEHWPFPFSKIEIIVIKLNCNTKFLYLLNFRANILTSNSDNYPLSSP